MLTPRYYQTEALQSVRAAIKAGSKSILLVAPTGAGKTVIAAMILKGVEEKRKFGLFLAHRREIIFQTRAKLERVGVQAGVLLSGEKQSALSSIQVGSVQTFDSWFVAGQKLMPSVDVLIFDEAHRSLASTYRKIRELYPNSILIGLTATPCRGDGRGLGDMYDDLIEVASIQQLIDEGYLVSPKVFAPSLPDLSHVAISGHDYNKAQLEMVMSARTLVGDIVGDWLARASDRKTVVFCSGIKHSLAVRDSFRAAGVRCEHIDGEMAASARDEILARLSAGDIQVVSSVDVLSEGWDQPEVACAIAARPTKSYTLYLQQIGRVLRPAPGKQDALILDHAGNTYYHGLVTDAGGWSLQHGHGPNSPIGDKPRSPASTEITCRNCWCVYPPTRSRYCPNCGWMPEPKAIQLNIKEGRLRRVDEVLREKPKKSKEQVTWDNSLYRASHKNLTVGAAAHIYKREMGAFPPSYLKNYPTKRTEWKMKAQDFLWRHLRR